MVILLIFIGWLITQAYAVLTAIKSVTDFNPKKFWKETKYKILVAYVLSASIGSALFFTIKTEGATVEYEGLTFNLVYLIYIIIGAFPEWVLQRIGKKTGLVKTEK